MMEELCFNFHCKAKLVAAEAEVNEWMTEDNVYSTSK
jgi:hypothetical protein